MCDVVSRLTFSECRAFSPSLENAKCVKVNDASTFYLAIVMSPPYGPVVFPCKLVGVTVPDIRSSQSHTKTLARIGKEYVRGIIMNKIVSARISGRDKYGRYLVRVYVASQAETDVATMLIEKGLAVSQQDGQLRSHVDWAKMLDEYMQCGISID
jgi:endonuclease YncB( thermonuclease family)